MAHRSAHTQSSCCGSEARSPQPIPIHLATRFALTEKPFSARIGDESHDGRILRRPPAPRARSKYHGSLQQTLDEITTAGSAAIAIQADLSKSEEQEQKSGERVEKVGEPDVLVSNAALRLAERLSSRDVSRVCQNWIGSVH